MFRHETKNCSSCCWQSSSAWETRLTVLGHRLHYKPVRLYRLHGQEMGSSNWEDITPDVVLNLEGPTTKFLCPLSANVFGIDFIDFEIKDVDSGTSLFRVQKDPDAAPMPMLEDLDPQLESAIRTIKYQFPPDFLRYKTVRVTQGCELPTGPQTVPHKEFL